MNVAGICMIRNEERHIREVLDCAAQFLPAIYVGDTGSTDGTLVEVAKARGNIIVTQFGQVGSKRLALLRGELAALALRDGFEWGWLLDGDELYYPECGKVIVETGMAPGKRLGCTGLMAVEQDEQGRMWKLDGLASRQAIFPLTDKWYGEDYPYETPESARNLDAGLATVQYFEMTHGLPVHGLHLHYLERSSRDVEVLWRNEKRFSICCVPGKLNRMGLLERWPA